MKRFLLSVLFISLIFLLAAQSNPVSDYFNAPDTHSFMSAYNYCAEMLAQDSTKVNLKIIMAILANAESQRIADTLSGEIDNLPAGNKFQYANLLLSQNKNEDAVKIYSQLNSAYPEWSCPWRHKGEAYYKLGKYKDAETALFKSIATNTSHYDAYVWMAKTQYQLKKYKEALKNLEHSFTLDPEEEDSPDEVISDVEIRKLYDDLLVKTGKKKK